MATATLTGSVFNVQSGLISVSLSGATAPLNMSGAGLVTLSGSNAYGGGTSILGGTLKLGNTAALGTAGLTLSGGTLDLNANSISLPTISGTGGLFTDSSRRRRPTSITFNQNSNVNFPLTVTNGPSKLLAVTKKRRGRDDSHQRRFLLGPHERQSGDVGPQRQPNRRKCYYRCLRAIRSMNPTAGSLAVPRPSHPAGR